MPIPQKLEKLLDKGGFAVGIIFLFILAGTAQTVEDQPILKIWSI